MEKYENLTEIIKENLIYYRKAAKLTQLELAEKLQYSDKSISKWERGEGVPDIYTLVKLSKLYGLSVNDFLTKNKKEKVANRFYSKVLITLISIALVWFLVTVAFVAVKIFVPYEINGWQPWLLFIYAIPASSIIWTIYNDVFFKKIYNILSVSLLCWTLTLSLYLSFINVQNISRLFLGAIPFQIMIVLFYLLLFKRKERTNKK